MLTDTVLIGYDRNPPDEAVLIVGRKRENETVEIINAFQGEEATELYEKLVTRKEKK